MLSIRRCCEPQPAEHTLRFGYVLKPAEMKDVRVAHSGMHTSISSFDVTNSHTSNVDLDPHKGATFL